jgi:hypothetical protein
MSDREYKTKIGWCRFCNQGWLEIWKTGKTGKLNIVCSECETQYDSPREALRKINPRLCSVGIDGFGFLPTVEELAASGWDWYIIGVPCFGVDFNERFVIATAAVLYCCPKPTNGQIKTATGIYCTRV